VSVVTSASCSGPRRLIVSADGGAPGDGDADVGGRRAAELCRLALTRDDPGMAGQVMSDVIVDECVGMVNANPPSGIGAAR
jgi:hypothetical protein